MIHLKEFQQKQNLESIDIIYLFLVNNHIFLLELSDCFIVFVDGGIFLVVFFEFSSIRFFIFHSSFVTFFMSIVGFFFSCRLTVSL